MAEVLPLVFGVALAIVVAVLLTWVHFVVRLLLWVHEAVGRRNGRR